MGRRIVCIKYLSHPGRNEFVDGFATHIQSLTGFLFKQFLYAVIISDTTRLANCNRLAQQDIRKRNIFVRLAGFGY